MVDSFREYSQAVAGLESLGQTICSLFTELLRDAGLSVHHVTHRVKTYDSTSRKLSNRARGMDRVGDLTDLLGVRVITYFADEVDAAANTLLPHLAIDTENSVDKRSLMDPDRFGYMSLHYVAQLNEDRATLAEYRRFGHLRFELQIRSILQHAWAEIEHDLGYKAVGAVPKQARRQFSKLAGLLEIADDQFSILRTELSEYARIAASADAEGLSDATIDRDTIQSFILASNLVSEVDNSLAIAASSGIAKTSNVNYAASLADALTHIGIIKIGPMASLLALLRRHVMAFANGFLSGEGTKQTVQPGICLFYLWYLLIAQLPESIGLRELTRAGLSEPRSAWERIRKAKELSLAQAGPLPDIDGLWILRPLA